MMAHIKIALVLALAHCVVGSKDKAEANPIRKIVGELEKMQAELETQAENEKELFDKAMCVCETGERDLQGVIDFSGSEITRLTSKIESETAEKQKLDKDLEAHAKDKVDTEKNLEEATALREKEHAKFVENEKVTMFSEDQLARAIPLFEKKGAASFMQMAQRRLFRNDGVSKPAQEDMEASDPDLFFTVKNVLDTGDKLDQMLKRADFCHMSEDDEDDSYATALVFRCRSRLDVLSSKQLRDLEIALDEAAERAMLHHIQAAEDDAEYENDFDELSEKDAQVKDEMSECMADKDGLLVSPPKQAISKEDATWLSQRFLMVMSEHHGWD